MLKENGALCRRRGMKVRLLIGYMRKDFLYYHETNNETYNYNYNYNRIGIDPYGQNPLDAKLKISSSGQSIIIYISGWPGFASMEIPASSLPTLMESFHEFAIKHQETFTPK